MALSFSSSKACTRGATRPQQQRPSLAIGTPVARRSGAVAPRHPVEARLFSGGDNKDDKKFLSRDEEPEEYWSSKGERAGSNPLSDPLAIIGILAIFFPFILLLVAIATGYIDLSVYK